MAKTRLNTAGRYALNELVRALVTAPTEALVVAHAYAVAVPLVRAMVEARYPQADMEILRRYDAAIPDHCLRIKAATDEMLMFHFDKDDTPPLRPRVYNCATVYLADTATTEALLRLNRATEACNAELLTKRADYEHLIAASRYFEDVVAIWPEAERVRIACGAAHLAVAVTNSVLERIRADVESRRTQLAEV